MAITAAVSWTQSLVLLGLGGEVFVQGSYPVGKNTQADTDESSIPRGNFSEASPRLKSERRSKDTKKTSDSETGSKNAREIVVTTESSEEGLETQTHPAGLIEINQTEARRMGTSTVSETLAKSVTWRSMIGNSGLGSVSTKLNVATRGVNPRFSSRTTILLDEIPLATAPYGRPQQLMFPLSMASVAKIQAFPGGNTLRYGPHNSGGVINLVSAAIPQHPSSSILIQTNHWGEMGLGASHAGYYGPLGVRVEYLPRFGRSFRDHSGRSIHGGLLKLKGKLGSRWSMAMMNHAYWEEVEIPGGLRRADYEKNPLSSVRSHDQFSGWRVGSSLKLQYKIGRQQRLQTIVYATRTERRSTIAQGVDGESNVLRIEPRSFDAVGLEPRLRLRMAHRRGRAWHTLWVGFRVAFERARMLGQERLIDSELPGSYLRYERNTIRALAGYVEDRVHFFDDRMELAAGIRFESVYSTRDDDIAGQSVDNSQWAPLPAVSWLFRPNQYWSVFANYGRSFAPPQFLQISLAGDRKQIRAETSDGAEVGVRLLQLKGFNAHLSLWYKTIENLSDVRFAGVEQPGTTEALGSETSLRWAGPKEVRFFRGLELGLSHAWTRGNLVDGPLKGNRLPWYPVHRFSADLVYRSPIGLRGGLNLESSGKYFTDYANTQQESADAAVGEVPEFTIVGVQFGYEKTFLNRLDLGLYAGIQNLFDQAWYTRTNDRNPGILPQQPRTFFLNLSLRYH